MRVIAYKDLPKLVGETLPPSDWIKIDQPMIDQFAKLTHDQQWIHVDVARATKEIGGPIAHGFLTLSMMSAMAMNTMRVEGIARAINYGFDKIRFTGVVPAGSRIRMVSSIKAVEEKSGGRLMTRACAIELERPDGTKEARPVVVADWLGMVFPA